MTRGIKLSPDERLRRLRLGDLRRHFEDRCRGIILPDDDAGRDYLKELLLPISLGPADAIFRARRVQVWGPKDRMQYEIEIRAPWMRDYEAEGLIIEIDQMPMWQRKPTAKTLGERQQVTYAERSRLHLWTIGACDMTEAAMAVIRKQKKRQQNKLRYAQSRAAYLAQNSLTKDQPWVLQGVSRATYYRKIKQEQTRETGQSQVNLTRTVLSVVSNGFDGWDSVVGECSRPSPPTPAVLSPSCVNDGFLNVDDAEWMVAAICPPESLVEAA